MLVPEECYSVSLTASFEWEGRGPCGGNGCRELLLFLTPHSSFCCTLLLKFPELRPKDGGKGAEVGQQQPQEKEAIVAELERLKLRGEGLLYILLALLPFADARCCFTRNFCFSPQSFPP